MLINCPNCNASYEVNPDIIPLNGRKLRCSNCREVFWCNPHDEENPTRKIEDSRPEPVLESVMEESVAENESNFEDNNLQDNEDITTKESENQEQGNNIITEGNAVSNSKYFDDDEDDAIEDSVNMQDIFQRLNLQSDEISKIEQNMNPIQKALHRASLATGWYKKTNRILYYSILGLFVILGLLYFRIEITRKLPFMNIIYSSIGMDAIIPGEGLEFSNVTRREYVLDDIPQMEIRGFINNTTDREVRADVLRVEVLDNDGAIVQQQNEVLPINYFVPHAKVPFDVVVVKPSALGKYIVVTFDKKED